MTELSSTEQRVARYRRWRQWTITAAAWVGVIVLIVGVVPTFGRYLKTTASLREQRQTIADLSTAQQTLHKTQEQVDQLEKATAALHEPGTPQQQISGFIADVRRLGRSTSLGEVAWTLGDHPERIDGLSLLPVQLHATGDYTAAQNFISALAALPRAIRLRDVEMTTDTPGSGRVDLRLTVDLVTAEAR